MGRRFFLNHVARQGLTCVCGDLLLFRVGSQLLSGVPGKYVPGDWVWTTKTHFKRKQPLASVLKGCLYLGCGGGGMSTELVLAMSGRCRGQVWVISRSDYGPTALLPLEDSYWSRLCRPSPHAPVSDIVRVLSIATMQRLHLDCFGCIDDCIGASRSADTGADTGAGAAAAGAGAGAAAGAGAGAGGVNSLSAIFPPGFDAKPWYDIVYPIVDVGSENGFIQFVHSLEMLLVLVGMSDKSVEHVQEIVAHW